MKLTKEQQAKRLAELRRPDGRYALQDIIAVTEFKGTEGVDFPKIEISSAVDIPALTEGDPAPFFVTLKVGRGPIVSGNGVFYGEDFMQELLRLIVSTRPTGGMGHIRREDLSSALPVPDLYWLGAVQQGEYAWGKAYVPVGECRDFLRRRRAVNGEVATSIFGYAQEMTWDEEHDAVRVVLHDPDETGNRGFDLEYIDLASKQRAGVPSLATVPHITTEMVTPTGEEKTMEKADILKALGVDDIVLLPETVKLGVIAQSDEVKVLRALRELLGLDDKGNVLETVKALVTAAEEDRKTAVAAKVTELVDAIKVESVRGIVRELIDAKAPKTVAEADAAFKTVMDSEHVEALMQAKIIETMGDPQRRPGTPANGNGKAIDEFVTIPADGADK